MWCPSISLIQWLVVRNSFNSYTEQTTLLLTAAAGEKVGTTQEKDLAVFIIKFNIQYKIQLRARAAKGFACSTMSGGEKRRASHMSARKNISVVF